MTAFLCHVSNDNFEPFLFGHGQYPSTLKDGVVARISVACRGAPGQIVPGHDVVRDGGGRNTCGRIRLHALQLLVLANLPLLLPVAV
jgi:hypothetical protein